MDLKPSYWCPCKKATQKHRHTERRDGHMVADTERNDMPANQGRLRTAENLQKLAEPREGFLLVFSERMAFLIP